jgi:hypothetical protein
VLCSGCDAEAEGICYVIKDGISGPNEAHSDCTASGGQLGKVETHSQWTAVKEIIDTLPNDQCIRFGAIKQSGAWQWRDGSPTFYQPVVEHHGGDQICSCWWSGNDNIYDAPCEEFELGSHYICSLPMPGW